MDNHFLHHPEVDGGLTRKHERRHMDTGNIYLPPLVRGNSHSYDGESAVETRELNISRESWPFNYVTETCKELNSITTTGYMLYQSSKITSTLDEIYSGVCERAHVATGLAEGLRPDLFMKNPFDPVEDYIVHKITLDPGCNVPGYAGAAIGYISALPTSQAKRWTNGQPRIDTYIGQMMTVSGVTNPSGFALAALLNTNTELDNDPIIDIRVYPGTAEIHTKMGYKVIPGDESAPFKRMTLQSSSLPKLFELKNDGWNHVVMLPTY